jgi:hypothetical protein
MYVWVCVREKELTKAILTAAQKFAWTEKETYLDLQTNLLELTNKLTWTYKQDYRQTYLNLQTSLFELINKNTNKVTWTYKQTYRQYYLTVDV